MDGWVGGWVSGWVDERWVGRCMDDKEGKNELLGMEGTQLHLRDEPSESPGELHLCRAAAHARPWLCPRRPHGPGRATAVGPALALGAGWLRLLPGWQAWVAAGRTGCAPLPVGRARRWHLATRLCGRDRRCCAHLAAAGSLLVLPSPPSPTRHGQTPYPGPVGHLREHLGAQVRPVARQAGHLCGTRWPAAEPAARAGDNRGAQAPGRGTKSRGPGCAECLLRSLRRPGSSGTSVVPSVRGVRGAEISSLLYPISSQGTPRKPCSNRAAFPHEAQNVTLAPCGGGEHRWAAWGHLKQEEQDVLGQGAWGTGWDGEDKLLLLSGKV
jgi:hypothetical protein